MRDSKDITISDDDFTDEELALIYGLDHGNISCEEDEVEHMLEVMGVWD